MGAPNIGRSLYCASPFKSLPVVMLYGVPAEKIIRGLMLIVCGRDTLPNTKNL